MTLVHYSPHLVDNILLCRLIHQKAAQTKPGILPYGSERYRYSTMVNPRNKMLVPESATVSARSARECLESPSTKLSEHTESSDIPMNISRAETITDGAVSGANYCRLSNLITFIISSFVRDLMKSPGKVAVALKTRQSSGTPTTVNPVLVNLESDSHCNSHDGPLQE